MDTDYRVGLSRIQDTGQVQVRKHGRFGMDTDYRVGFRQDTGYRVGSGEETWQVWDRNRLQSRLKQDTVYGQVPGEKIWFGLGWIQTTGLDTGRRIGLDRIQIQCGKGSEYKEGPSIKQTSEPITLDPPSIKT